MLTCHLVQQSTNQGLFDSAKQFPLCAAFLHLIGLRLQFSSIAQLCLTLCHPMDCSTTRFPVHLLSIQLLEFAQTYVPLVADTIQPSHPLSSSSPPAFSLS